MASLKTAFDQYFDVLAADSPDLRDIAYQIRYQVYCVETGFEDATCFPSLREQDAYDWHSTHSLLRHKASGEYAGTVRLVLADPDDPRQPFPIEAKVGQHFDTSRVQPFRLPRQRVAEISRLAIARRFLSRLGDAGQRGGVAVADENGTMQTPEHRRFPHIILGLYMAIVRMSAEHEISHWYAMMEPSLARLLQRFGIHFQAIGPVMDYRGQRQPYLGVVEEVLAGIHRLRPEIWAFLTDEGKYYAASASPAVDVLSVPS